MLYYLCLVLICGLTTAQVTTCPDGKTSCGKGKTCCFSNGRFTCCDLVDDPHIFPGSPSLRYLNSTHSKAPSSGVTYAAPDPLWDYCPATFGKKICCDASRVNCITRSDCCSNGNCCFHGMRCCGNGQWCCAESLECGAYYMTCRGGTTLPPRYTTPKPQTWDYCPNNFGRKICCDALKVTCIAGSDCCSNGNCCFRGQRCCGNGQWCCAKSQKCGTYYKTCYSGAKGIYPVVGLILAAVVSLLLNGKAHFFL